VWRCGRQVCGRSKLWLQQVRGWHDAVPYGFKVVICVSVVQGSVSAVLEHQASVLDKQQQSYTTRLASTVSPAATAAAAAAVDQPSQQQQQELTVNTRRRKADRVSARTSSALQAGQQQLSGQVYGSSSGSGLAAAAAAAADSNSSGALVQQQQPELSTRSRSRSPSSAGAAAAAVVDAAFEDAEHRDSDLAAAATTESQQPSAAAAAGDASRGAGGHPARMSVVWDMAQVMVPFADAVLEPPRTVSGIKVPECGLLKSTVSPPGIEGRYCFERGKTGVCFKRTMKSAVIAICI
jgi:hypothetical protein